MFSLIIYILTAAIGLMMGILYKRSITTAQFFNPEPKKLFNGFLLILCIALVITFSLSGWMLYLLSDSKIAEESMMQFNNAKQVLLFFINLFFLLLIILSNIYSQSLKKIALSTYLLGTLFYVLFILSDAFILYDHYVMWQELMSMEITGMNIEGYHKTALMKVSLGFAVSVFNAGAIWWGFRK